MFKNNLKSLIIINLLFLSLFAYKNLASEIDKCELEDHKQKISKLKKLNELSINKGDIKEKVGGFSSIFYEKKYENLWLLSNYRKSFVFILVPNFLKNYNKVSEINLSSKNRFVIHSNYLNEINNFDSEGFIINKKESVVLTEGKTIFPFNRGNMKPTSLKIIDISTKNIKDEYKLPKKLNQSLFGSESIAKFKDFYLIGDSGKSSFLGFETPSIIDRFNPLRKKLKKTILIALVDNKFKIVNYFKLISENYIRDFLVIKDEYLLALSSDWGDNKNYLSRENSLLLYNIRDIENRINKNRTLKIKPIRKFRINIPNKSKGMTIGPIIKNKYTSVLIINDNDFRDANNTTVSIFNIRNKDDCELYDLTPN